MLKLLKLMTYLLSKIVSRKLTCPLPLLEWSCIGPGPVPNPLGPPPLSEGVMGVVGTTLELCIAEDVSTGFWMMCMDGGGICC